MAPRSCRSRALGILLALLPLATTVSGAAQETVFEADAGRTSVEITLGATFHTVHGNFRLKSGTIRFDPATSAASGELVVDARSGNTGNPSRDRKMHEEILESRRYPEIRFTVQQVGGTVAAEGASQVQLKGILTLHGEAHEMTITAPVQAAHGAVTAEAHFTVPYVQWGLKNPSTFFLRVERTVEVTVHAVGWIRAAPDGRN